MIPAIDHGTILVIDDEPDNLRLALELLREHGLEVLSARDGPAGLHIAGHLRPDLILLDIGMPGLDGFQVCRRLKAAPATRDCPVIFLTALGTIKDKARGFAAGGVDYVTKPFDARELLLRITSHLRLARRLVELQDRLLDYGPPVPPDPGSARPTRPLELLLRARDTLLANLTDPPDLATLARHCGTNRTSLQRLFKEYLGMTVFGYLREQRLQRARCLLEQGHSIGAAAAAVGYFDRRDLTRAFKQRFGVGPNALSKVA